MKKKVCEICNESINLLKKQGYTIREIDPEYTTGYICDACDEGFEEFVNDILPDILTYAHEKLIKRLDDDNSEKSIPFLHCSND